MARFQNLICHKSTCSLNDPLASQKSKPHYLHRIHQQDQLVCHLDFQQSWTLWVSCCKVLYTFKMLHLCSMPMNKIFHYKKVAGSSTENIRFLTNSQCKTDNFFVSNVITYLSEAKKCFFALFRPIQIYWKFGFLCCLFVCLLCVVCLFCFLTFKFAFFKQNCWTEMLKIHCKHRHRRHMSFLLTCLYQIVWCHLFQMQKTILIYVALLQQAGNKQKATKIQINKHKHTNKRSSDHSNFHGKGQTNLIFRPDGYTYILCINRITCFVSWNAEWSRYPRIFVLPTNSTYTVHLE